MSNFIPKLPQTPPALPAMNFWKRLSLWLSTIFIDHSFFRVWFNLRKRVSEDLFRSSHPMPYQLRGARRAGIRSVINLRGSDDSIASNVLERAECEKIGLPLAHFSFLSRAAPRVEDILGFDALLDQLPKPILLHCKSGADRAGIACAVYLLLKKNATPEEAAKQLCFWPHGHIRQANTGVLDHFVDAYGDYHNAHGTPFREWLVNHYDPDAVQSSFHATGWANRLVDGILRRE